MSWLKFDTATPEKPEVFAITIALGWEDPDLTVGKLLKVWRWFDLHSVDGNASSVTLALLDRLIGVTGLSQAMLDVGWLEVSNTGLTLPNFENHNGKTAKDRALTAKRAANYRSSDKSNASSVTNALPREEKRREEKRKSVCGQATPPHTQISDDFMEILKTKRPELNAEQVYAGFVDHYPESKRSLAKWEKWVDLEKVADLPPSLAITTPSRKAVDPLLSKAIQESSRTFKPVAEIHARLRREQRIAA